MAYSNSLIRLWRELREPGYAGGYTAAPARRAGLSGFLALSRSRQWIGTGKAYDAVIDFDKATRDPDSPKVFLPLYDSCDHLHPSDAGYKAMADAVDLSLFKR